MSEAPDPPSTSPEPPESETHDLGEELRRELHHLEEKVEEVVEHVPRPVRWTIGKIGLPKWKAGPPSKRRAPGFDFHLVLHQADVHMPETENDVSGLDLDALAATGQPTRVELRRMSWRAGPRGTVLQQLSGDLAVSD